MNSYYSSVASLSLDVLHSVFDPENVLNYNQISSFVGQNHIQYKVGCYEPIRLPRLRKDSSLLIISIN